MVRNIYKGWQRAGKTHGAWVSKSKEGGGKGEGRQRSQDRGRLSSHVVAEGWEGIHGHAIHADTGVRSSHPCGARIARRGRKVQQEGIQLKEDALS